MVPYCSAHQPLRAGVKEGREVGTAWCWTVVVGMLLLEVAVLVVMVVVMVLRMGRGCRPQLPPWVMIMGLKATIL